MMDIIIKGAETFVERILDKHVGRFLELIAGRTSERLTPIHAIQVTTTAHDQALKYLKWRGREEGGLLLGPADHHCVTHFIPDEEGVGTPGSFTLGASWLNAVLKKYVALGLDAKGVIHMHPPGYQRLSSQDMEYARKLMGNPKNTVDRLLMPLVVDGRMIPYIIFPDEPETAHEGELVLF